MDIQQYISSGVIEACVLGNASDSELHELRILANQHPEIKEVWEELQINMEKFASLNAQKPPEYLREQIWNAILEEGSPNKKTSSQKLVPLVKKKSNTLQTALLAATILLLIGSSIWNFLLLRQQNQTAEKLSALEKEQQQMLVKNQEYETQLSQLNKDLQLFTNPKVITIPLNGVGDHSANKAFAYWDGNSKMVYLSLKDLPEPPMGKQYQLWAIDNGKPHNAGVYPLDSSGMDIHEMKVIQSAQTFAVTLENEGGVPEPTLTEMYVAGNIAP